MVYFLRLTAIAACALSIVSCAPASNFVSGRDETTQEGADKAPPLTDSELEKISRFKEPILTTSEKVSTLARYGHLDPNHEIPDRLLEKAVVYYDANQVHMDNKDYLSIVDFSQHSSKPRFYIINMASGAVSKFHVAHGKGSDSNDDGIAESFSNVSGSEQSSLGFYKTAETYDGKHGRSLRLDGLSATNSNVRDRAIVVHGADYVYTADKKAGRSWGCLAFSMAEKDKIISMLKGGSIIFADR